MSTKIEWTEDTWNPVSGCTKISAGCKHCYAERMAIRLAGRAGYPAKPNQFKVTLHPERLEIPLHWRQPRRIFVNSMSDLFHEDVPISFIDDILSVIAACPQHTFQVLTKRPENMMEKLYKNTLETPFRELGGGDYLPNVWIGVSVEDQKTADERIPWLLKTPAAVRFVSYEPALGLVDFIGPWPKTIHDRDWLLGDPGLDWIIAGGESGPGARPAHPDWFRSVRDQCQEAGVPFFFKQWGEWFPTYPFDKKPEGNLKNHQWNSGVCAWKVGKNCAGRLLDGREWNEYSDKK